MTLPRTRISELLGLDHPVVQGPFGGGLSSLELAADVSNAGGLGSFGAQHLSPAELTETVDALRTRTDRAFNVNLWVSTHDVPEEEVTDDIWDAAVARLKRSTTTSASPRRRRADRAADRPVWRAASRGW